MHFWLTGLDVNAIQSYIHASGKLKEIVGASFLVDRYTSQRPGEIFKELGAQQAEDPARLPLDGPWFFPLRQTGGVVRILAPSQDLSVAWARRITAEILECAPGLDVSVAHERVDWEAGSLRDANTRLTQRLHEKRVHPRVGGACTGLPFTAPCSLTGQPAYDYGDEPNERLSRPSLMKRQSADEAHRSFAGELVQDLEADDTLAACLTERGWLTPDNGTVTGRLRFALDFTALSQGGEQPSERVMAIARFDANNLGAIVRQRLDAQSGNAAMAKALRESSNDLNQAAQRALVSALTRTLTDFVERWPEGRGCPFAAEGRKLVLPFRPLVQGGDDVTVVLRGDMALPFAEAFIRAFEQETQERTGSLCMAGGIALVKVNSPFQRGYELAETLIDSAKGNREQSCVDFHVVKGQTAPDITAVRESEYQGQNGERLTKRPYTAADLSKLLENARETRDMLPRSQLKRAAELCREGEAAAEGPYRDLVENLARRLGGRSGAALMDTERFEELFPEGFFQENQGIRETALLDYLELAEFCGTQGAERE